jgi:hypothetical protein
LAPRQNGLPHLAWLGIDGPACVNVVAGYVELYVSE